MCGKNVSIYVVHIPRKFIKNMYFLLMPQSPTQNSRQNFLKICIAQDEMGGGNYDFFCQNPIRKYEDNLEHEFIYILYDL